MSGDDVMCTEIHSKPITVSFTCYLPPDLAEWVREQSEQQFTTRAAIVRQAIQLYRETASAKEKHELQLPCP
jgi:hypothetical protein